MGSSSLPQGADVLDIGGESTRPGAEPVGAEEELRRTEPVVKALAGAGHSVSIDTSKAEVAAAALDAGARIVNDVTAFRGDPDIAALCAERGCDVVLMHMLGTPRTMQDDPTLRRRRGRRQGIPLRARRVSRRRRRRRGSDLGRSRASASARRSSTTSSSCAGSASCGTWAGRSSSARRASASSARSPGARRTSGSAGRSPRTSLRSLNGADAFRVHDVAEVKEALDVAEALLGRRSWKAVA